MIAELQQLVSKLNGAAYDVQQNNSVIILPFNLVSDGDSLAIRFDECYTLWGSEDSPTDSIEEVRQTVAEEFEKMALPMKQLLSMDLAKLLEV